MEDFGTAATEQYHVVDLGKIVYNLGGGFDEVLFINLLGARVRRFLHLAVGPCQQLFDTRAEVRIATHAGYCRSVEHSLDGLCKPARERRHTSFLIGQRRNSRANPLCNIGQHQAVDEI